MTTTLHGSSTLRLQGLHQPTLQGSFTLRLQELHQPTLISTSTLKSAASAKDLTIIRT